MYYTNDDIRVIMALNESLDGSTVKVNFTDPESTVTTEVSPTTIDGKRVIYDIPRAANDKAGNWVFWCVVTNAEGKVASSTELTFTTRRRGT